MRDKTGKSSLLGNSRKYYAIIGLFIMTIAVVHFALQIMFIQKENVETVETAVEIENPFEPEAEDTPPVKQVIEIAPDQVEVKKVEVITIPEAVKTAPRRRTKEIAPAPKPLRKKVVRETRAERLRRAERILTGV